MSERDSSKVVIKAHRVIEWVTAPIFVLITVYFQRVSGWLTH